MTTVYCTKGHDNQDSNRFCQICGEKLPLPTVHTLMAGNVLEDRYRIVQQIGQGGFGRTYLCENLTRFNEPCVLKEFAPQVQGTYALEKAKKLFEREASVLHNLQHNQIPRFRELFQMRTGGQGLFLVQDYVAGQTYRYLLASRQNQHQLFSEAEVKQLMIDTLPVLEYIHSLGVIHRDIAPDNLMLRSSDNLPILIDFGGVKQIALNAEIQATGNTDVPTCLGKVGYAPHEQMQRGTVAANSDLYALAATAMVLMTGKEPTELIDPQSLNWNWRSTITLAPQFHAVLERMLQPNPAARYQTATEVLQALQAEPQAITTAPATIPTGKSPVKTVVVAPGSAKTVSSPRASSAVVSGGGDSSFLQILGRSWLAILAVGAVGAGAWAGISMFGGKSDQPSSPTIISPSPTTKSEATPSSSATPSTSSSPTTAASPSPSTSDKPEKTADANKPDATNTDKTSSTRSNGGNNSGKERSSERQASQNKTPQNRQEKETNTEQQQPRRATNSNTRQNSTPTKEEATPTTPQVETYNTSPRNTNEDSTPRTPARSTESKPARQTQSSKPQRSTSTETKPQVETYTTKPTRKQAEVQKPASSDSGAKKPTQKKESDGENDPLF
jgi:serine/threonine protein kinase